MQSPAAILFDFSVLSPCLEDNLFKMSILILLFDLKFQS
jgi:hypothetical protein